MAAQGPDRDPAAHEATLARVRLDKESEAEDGFEAERTGDMEGFVVLLRATAG
ncbi:hypothetical protein ACFU3E_09760 [Streptomyces sp. NPDC057424]|uniref:hypothetical protein n=1 Tax=Streptomyces sp. NPDC057424 TaxID=3346127 RepID=UPI0036B1FC05